MSTILRISVVLCTYNGADFLDAQLASLLAQTRLPDELLIRDDVSTDGTVAIARAFAQSAPFPVRVQVNAKNLGPHANFSVGLADATGDILFTCDQDDVWLPDKLRKVEAVFLAHPDTGLVLVDADLVDDRLTPLGKTLWQELGFDAGRQQAVELGRGFYEFIRAVTVYGCTMAFRADLRRHCLPVSPSCSFDSWIAMLAAAVSPVRLVKEPLQLYRQHAKQAFGAKGTTSRLARLRQQWRASDLKWADWQLGMNVDLFDRLQAADGLGQATRWLEIIRARKVFAHDRRRMRLSLLARLPLALKHLVIGSYKTSARGLPSAVLDMISPLASREERMKRT